MREFDQILSAFKEGDSIFIPGASAEPRALVEALSKQSADLPKLHITNTFLPGINTVDLASPDNTLCERVFFPRGGKLFGTERVEFTRSSWMQAYQYLEKQSFDWLVVHLSPPDKNGACSLGPSVEFLPMLLQKNCKIIGIINENMPKLPGAPTLDVGKLDLKIGISDPLVTYDTSPADSVSKKIAANLSALVDDESILQVGLGNVPDQFARSLHDRRKLKFQSGMLSDSFLALHDAGALDQAFPHTCTLTLGSADFYQRLPEVSNLNVVGVETSHAAVRAPQGGSFTAINSALQIDISGRANLEHLGLRRVSNVGGALDFSKRAESEKTGRNIIALPATASGGKVSRIVADFESEQHNSLGDYSVDYIVTEFGVAHISDLFGARRAEAIIGLAAPKFHSQLMDAMSKNISS